MATQYLTSINPVTNEKLHAYPIIDAPTIETKIQNAQDAYLQNKINSIEERTTLLKQLAEQLKLEKESLASMATLEMGKPYKQSIAEVEKCAMSLEYYADNGAQFLEPEIVNVGAKKSAICYQPLGVVLAIMPWNFPFWQAYRALGPIILAGNSMLLKHASNVSGCSTMMEEIANKANWPKGLFQSLIFPSSQMNSIIAHPTIQAVTFTGSTIAGKIVAAEAAKHLKKQVLELGGSDAYIVLEDADIDLAAKICTDSRLINSGQSCIAAKRFIVIEKVADEFTRKVKAIMEKVKYGDPFNDDFKLGSIARKDLRDQLHQQVVESLAKGAKLLCGGELPEGPGAFYPATVLSNVQKGMPAYDEELFGPVAAIIVAKDEEEAILIANDTEYGLGAAIFSKDLERAEKLAIERVEAGSVFVNELVSSKPQLPFGGIKQSGYGRELSYLAPREFSNIKTILIESGE